MRTRRITTVILVALVALATLAAWSWWNDDTSFDAERWKAARATACSDEGDGVRARMVGDLTENHLAVGMEQRDVVDLLGRPDRSPRAALEWATQSGLTRCWFLRVAFAQGRLVATDHYY